MYCWLSELTAAWSGWKRSNFRRPEIKVCTHCSEADYEKPWYTYACSLLVLVFDTKNQGCHWNLYRVALLRDTDSGHVLLLDCTLSLVLRSLGRCAVLVGRATSSVSSLIMPLCRGTYTGYRVCQKVPQHENRNISQMRGHLCTKF